MGNTAISLAYFASGDHARRDDVKLELKRIADTLRAQVLTLATEENNEDTKSGKRNRSRETSSQGSELLSDDSDSEEDLDEKEENLQFSLSLAFRRLLVLSKRCNIAELLGDDQLDELLTVICEGMSERLSLGREKLFDGGQGKCKPTNPANVH